jgi:hypothetical protein
MASDIAENGERSRWARAGTAVLHEIRLVIPPTLFFFVGFNLILFTKRLFLADYLIAYAGFLIATTSALIVGKVVLVADKLPFLARFDNEPLAYPILFKSFVYTLLVFVARLLEAFIHYAVEGNVIGGGAFIRHQLGDFSWSHFIAVQLWIFVLFLIYVTANELNELFGDGELRKLLFKRRSSSAKATRRARVRMLVRLTRLTDANSPEELANPASKAHVELTTLLRGLAEKRT